MEKKKVGLKPFFSLILSTGIPKLALTVRLNGRCADNTCRFGCPIANEKFSGWLFSGLAKRPDYDCYRGSIYCPSSN